MIGLGLTTAEQAAFHAALAGDHAVDVRVSTLTLDHDLIGTVSRSVVGGQVDIDTTQPVDRSCSVSVRDPGNALGLRSNDAWAVDLYADRLLRIEYGVNAEGLGRWVWVPIFTGRISTSEWSGDVLTITGHGKESRGLRPNSINAKWPKGTRKTDIIRGMLAAMGEGHMEIPTLPDRSTVLASVGPRDGLWDRAQGWVRSLGMRLVYDGRGVAVLRPLQLPLAWTFRDGDGGTLLSQPRRLSDTTRIRNLVVVTGGAPEGSKTPVTAVAYAPSSHPLSAVRLQSAGVPDHIREDIEDSAITSKAVAQKVANAKLSELLQGSLDVSFDAAVIPHLEPWDPYRVTLGGKSWDAQIQRASIPLVGARMTVGKFTLTRRITR